MTQRDEQGISASRAEEGVTTAPALSAADEIAELRVAIARLDGRLAELDAEENAEQLSETPWES